MRPSRVLLRRIPAAAASLVLLAGCTGTPASSPSPAASTCNGASAAPLAQWPAPPNAMQLATDAGLVPETTEHLEFHVHAHLDVFIDGKPVVVPAGIGINIEDPDVHRFDDPGDLSYGIETCAQPCISPLHTHHASGIIHTESATPKPNTLGQFFIEWAVKLSDTCVGELCEPQTAVAFYVNGDEFTGDPTTIELADRTEIAIVIGTPPPVIPSTADFSRP
jgi:hypothetical protein